MDLLYLAGIYADVHFYLSLHFFHAIACATPAYPRCKRHVVPILPPSLFSYFLSDNSIRAFGEKAGGSPNRGIPEEGGNSIDHLTIRRVYYIRVLGISSDRVFNSPARK